MRSADYYLNEYAKDHQNRINQVLHKVCVPAIMVSLLGMLWSIPVPAAMVELGPYANWATLFIAVTLVYYVLLSPRCALAMLPVVVLSVLVVEWLGSIPWPLWQTSLTIFVVAWIGQFVGHAVEGRRPAFFRDLRFLLIGPLWVLAGPYQRLGFALARTDSQD